MSWRSNVSLVLAAAAISCSAPPGEDARPAARAATLAEGDVAVVGDQHIAGATVRAIASAQGTSLREARERAIRDALFAAEQRARGRAPRAAEAALLARELLAAERRRLEGPASDAEVEEVTKRHWLELDRPEGFRVVHVVLLAPSRKKGDPPTTEAAWAPLEAAADRIVEAAAPVVEAAKRVPPDDAAVKSALERVVKSVAGDAGDAGGSKVELLDPVAADGRVLKPQGGRFAIEFATAVAKLRERGEVSPKFRSPFGVHVAVLLGRTPEERVDLERRRAWVRDEVIETRLRDAREKLLEPSRANVEVAVNAAALLDLVPISSGPRGVAQGGP